MGGVESLTVRAVVVVAAKDDKSAKAGRAAKAGKGKGKQKGASAEGAGGAPGSNLILAEHPRAARGVVRRGLR